ncbi:MAG: pilus assembly protein PilM [Synergistaceae bacterium]|nr:pilus assembly protein PilM [Synergistaceae bacterium]
MPLTIRKNPIQRNSAGLAIHADCLRFIEIDEEQTIFRQETVPLGEGCVINNTIKDFGILETAFAQLYKVIGRLREPVVIGLPSGDTIIRLLNMPNMSIDDVRGTIDLNFEEYFPYPRPDAVFDTIRVMTPADVHEREEITIMAVSAKREMVERLLGVARKCGLPAGALEPLNFSMLRAIPEAREGLSLFADPSSIVALYNGNGIFYRAANNLHGAQDILNTMQFMATQYRHDRVGRLILEGLNFQVGSDSGMEIVNITDEFFAARGLALRGEPDVQRLDLRPSEYVELERRRYSFNPNRLLFWGLLVGFIMLSAGTISFAWMRIADLETALEDKRIANSDLLAQRDRLQRTNTDLESKKRDTEKILDFLRSDIPVLEIMNAIESHTTVGVKLEEADFSRNAMTGVTVILDGKASSEKAILTMTDGLKRSDMFTDVRLPVSQKALTGQIVFKIILRAKEVL